MLVMRQVALPLQSKTTQLFFISKKKKSSNKKRSRSDMLFDRLSYSMNSLMKAPSQADNEFLSNLLVKEEQNKKEKVLFEFAQKEIRFV